MAVRSSSETLAWRQSARARHGLLSESIGSSADAAGAPLSKAQARQAAKVPQRLLAYAGCHARFQRHDSKCTVGRFFGRLVTTHVIPSPLIAAVHVLRRTPRTLLMLQLEVSAPASLQVRGSAWPRFWRRVRIARGQQLSLKQLCHGGQSVLAPGGAWNGCRQLTSRPSSMPQDRILTGLHRAAATPCCWLLVEC